MKRKKIDVVRRYKEIRDEIICARRKSSELLWAQVFHDFIEDGSWILRGGKSLQLSLGRGAIGYPTAYIIFRILDELKCNNILELGMGQSTDIISRFALYMKQQGAEISHYAVEHDEKWAEICKQKYKINYANVMVMDLDKIEMPVNSGKYTYKYSGFESYFLGKKFGLIIVDGPYGYNNPYYSRIDILSIIPNCLEDTFCIVFDDWDRNGEKNTVRLLEQKLAENEIGYQECLFSGEKDTCVLVSKNLEYMRFY